LKRLLLVVPNLRLLRSFFSVGLISHFFVITTVFPLLVRVAVVFFNNVFRFKNLFLRALKFEVAALWIIIFSSIFRLKMSLRFYNFAACDWLRGNLRKIFLLVAVSLVLVR
jgi:hypothetical protein